MKAIVIGLVGICLILLALWMHSSVSIKNNEITNQSGGSNSDIFASVNAGDTAAVRRLCSEGIDVNQVNDEGMTPLHRASLWGNPEIVAELIAHGAAVDKEDPRGWTPLHIAAMQGRRSLINALLKAGADRNKRDKLGNTPFDWAVRQKRDDAAKLLAVP